MTNDTHKVTDCFPDSIDTTIATAVIEGYKRDSVVKHFDLINTVKELFNDTRQHIVEIQVEPNRVLLAVEFITAVIKSADIPGDQCAVIQNSIMPEQRELPLIFTVSVVNTDKYNPLEIVITYPTKKHFLSSLSIAIIPYLDMANKSTRIKTTVTVNRTGCSGEFFSTYIDGVDHFMLTGSALTV